MKYLDPVVLKHEQGNCNGNFGRRLLTVEWMNLVKCPDGLKLQALLDQRRRYISSHIYSQLRLDHGIVVKFVGRGNCPLVHFL